MDLFAGLAPEPTKKYVLRDYQQSAVDAGVDFFEEEDNHEGHALMVEPTASGKSLVIAGIIDRMQEPVVVFQPSREILMQNYDKLRGYGYHPAIFSASLKRKRISDITLATIGSVHNAHEQFKGFKHIIIDEAHRVEAKTSTDYVMGKPTATPYRLYSTREYGAENRFITRTREKIFSRVIHHTQISELLDQGYLSPMRYYTIPGFTREGITMNSSGSDFNDQALIRRFQEIGFGHMVYNTVSKLQTMCKGILVFTKFVAEAREFAERLPNAAVVSDKTEPDERTRIFKDFLAGRIQVLANVGVATTGFDYPKLDAVVIARPTMSLALWTQMVGRGARIAEGKDHCKIVDMCENLPLFGKMEDMKLKCRSHGLWFIESQGRELTNRPYSQR